MFWFLLFIFTWLIILLYISVMLFSCCIIKSNVDLLYHLYVQRSYKAQDNIWTPYMRLLFWNYFNRWSLLFYFKTITSNCFNFCKPDSVFSDSLYETFFQKYVRHNFKHKSRVVSQRAITCSKLTIKTLEQCVKYVQN